MGKVTTINWTDHTFNPWEGCTKVSPGCDHCYAAARSHHWRHDVWGKWKPRWQFAESHWDEPPKWNRTAKREGVRHKVFCGSLCDVMDDEAPEGLRERLWTLIDQTPNLIWQLLTKRPHRYERYLPADFRHDNVWLGTSAENQHFYNIRWPILRRVAEKYNAIAFISYEPALGPLSMRETPSPVSYPDWIICGGESGAHHRPMEQQWAESLRDECREHGIAFHMKQMSARTPKQGAALIPVELLIRQFPESRKALP